MNKKVFFESLSYIDDSLLAEAGTYKKQEQGNKVVFISVVVACLFLTILIGGWMWRGISDNRITDELAGGQGRDEFLLSNLEDYLEGYFDSDFDPSFIHSDSGQDKNSINEICDLLQNGSIVLEKELIYGDLEVGKVTHYKERVEGKILIVDNNGNTMDYPFFMYLDRQEADSEGRENEYTIYSLTFDSF